MFKTFLIVKYDAYTEKIINVVFVCGRFSISVAIYVPFGSIRCISQSELEWVPVLVMSLMLEPVRYLNNTQAK